MEKRTKDANRPARRIAAIVFIIAALLCTLGFANAFLYEMHLFSIAPGQPDMTTGHTFDVNNHGTHRFERPADRDFASQAYTISFIGAGISWALAFLADRKLLNEQASRGYWRFIVIAIILGSYVYWS